MSVSSAADDIRRFRLLVGMAATLLTDATAHRAAGDPETANASAIEGLETMERLARVYCASAEFQATELGERPALVLAGDHIAVERLGALSSAVAGCEAISAASRKVLTGDLRRLQNREPAAAASLMARSKAAARRIKAITGRKV